MAGRVEIFDHIVNKAGHILVKMNLFIMTGAFCLDSLPSGELFKRFHARAGQAVDFFILQMPGMAFDPMEGHIVVPDGFV